MIKYKTKLALCKTDSFSAYHNFSQV